MLTLFNSFLIYFYFSVFVIENFFGFSITSIRGLSLNNFSISVLLMGFVFNCIFRRNLIYRNNLNIFLLLMILMLFISIPIKILLDEIPRESLLRDILSVKQHCDPWIVFFIFSNILNDKRTTKRVIFGLLLMLALSILLLLLAVFNIVEIGRVHTSHFGRAGFMEPNQYAALLVLFIPLLISYIITERAKLKKIIAVSYSFTAFLSLFCTGSRGGFFAFALNMFTYVIILWKNSILNKGIIVILIFLLPFAAIGGYAFAPPRYKVTMLNRIDPTAAENIDEYTSGRAHIWGTGIELFLESPIFGHGLHAFRDLYDLQFGVWLPTHNDYLMYLVNYGVIGLLIFIMIYVQIFRHMLVSIKSSENSLNKILYISYTCGAIGYVVAFFGVNIYNPIRIMFWIYTAAIYRYATFEKAAV